MLYTWIMSIILLIKNNQKKTMYMKAIILLCAYLTEFSLFFTKIQLIISGFPNEQSYYLQIVIILHLTF